jgi:hypothetical protein
LSIVTHINTGTPTIVDVNKNIIQKKIFVKNNFSVGTPDIKPTKASYFTSAKTIQPSKLPPQPFRNLQAKELKKSRPLMKAHDKSVLNRGAKPKALPVNTVTKPRTPGKGKPMIQQVKPAERVKPSGPAVSPTDRGKKQQVKPAEKKPVAPEGGPAPRGERQIKPSEKRAVVPEGGPAPKGERKQVKPEDIGKPGVPECGPGQKDEKNPDKCPQKGQKK